MCFQIKIARDIESKINVSFTPGACCLPNILRFNHTLGIGKDELKYMSACFNIPAERK